VAEGLEAAKEEATARVGVGREEEVAALGEADLEEVGSSRALAAAGLDEAAADFYSQPPQMSTSLRILFRPICSSQSKI
jgi:hypothetical protein